MPQHHYPFFAAWTMRLMFIRPEGFRVCQQIAVFAVRGCEQKKGILLLTKAVSIPEQACLLYFVYTGVHGRLYFTTFVIRPYLRRDSNSATISSAF
jgi:hypothetical protein